MIKKSLENLDLDVYLEVFDNNLKLFVVPINKLNDIYVTFSTNYGSIQDEFIPLDENKMIKVPLGVAHFLEHKLFAEPDGSDPFTFFTERGCDANANTSNFKTTYLFSGTDFFEENLNYLLDYVQNPYFTDENVDEEKGIIEQEIKMYKDDPYSRLYDGILLNSFVNHPIRYPVIGNIKSINSITKEILYKCYDTFYNPSNMFVVVTGNVDPLEVERIIRDNQSKKEFKKSKEIVVKTYNEPDNVFKEKEEIKLNVTIPKIAISYKFNLNKIKMFSLRKKIMYLSILFDLNFGLTSLLNEKLKEEHIIINDLFITSVNTDDHILFIINAESNNPNRLEEVIKKQINNMDITEEELERVKKSLISSYIFMSDNIFSINNKIMNDLIRYNEVIYDNYSEIKSLNIKEAKAILKNLSFSNNSTFIIKPKK